MMSKAEVAQLARDCGLAGWAGDLASTVSLGWALAASSEPSAVSGSSKIGGLPDLAPGEEWPFNGRGIPMTLMAQLDLARLEPPSEGWTLDDASWSIRRGVMRIFADLVDSPIDMCKAVIMLCSHDAPLHRAPLPAVPDPWPPGGTSDVVLMEERYRSFPEIAVTLLPFLSAPETHHEIDTGDGPPDSYRRWLQQLRIGENGDEVLHALAGHPHSLHDDIREATALNYGRFVSAEDGEDLADADAWRPLLSLFDDDAYGLQIADGGSFVVLAPAQDLVVGRYDRLICVPETC
jgi:hypothetical protein